MFMFDECVDVMTTTGVLAQSFYTLAYAFLGKRLEDSSSSVVLVVS